MTFAEDGCSLMFTILGQGTVRLFAPRKKDSAIQSKHVALLIISVAKMVIF